MSDRQTLAATGAGSEVRAAPQRTRWTGWITFAACMMVLVGAIHVIQGIAALANPDYYAVGPNGLAIHANYTVWGWVHLVLGVAVFLSGVGLFTGNPVARVVAVVLVGLSAVGAVLFAQAAPVWAVIVIAVDLLVAWALVVHGREMAL
jgi:hypothetical protein